MTMTDSTPTARPTRQLRRSRQDRILSGVCGGLGEYFAVDAVIFRVLFAVVSFFGGVGLLVYGLAWLLLPEPGVEVSALDKTIAKLRERHVPPWLVVAATAVVLWLGGFSWWAPGAAFPALALVAVLAVVLINRMKPTAPSELPPTQPGNSVTETLSWPAPSTPPEFINLTKDPIAAGETATPDERQTRLIPPLNDTRRGMQAWLSEASAARKLRISRRRPIKIAVALTLIAGWAVVALLDAARRMPFPVYLWVGLGVLAAGLLVSIATRRMMLSLLVPLAMIGLLAFLLGGTRASLRDGSGRVGWQPTNVGQLTDHRVFAGQSTLDLTKLAKLDTAHSLTITQAAGEVLVKIPRNLNVTVVSSVHLGDIQDGDDRSTTGHYATGMNIDLELAAPAATPGPTLTVQVELTDGHVQVDRAG